MSTPRQENDVDLPVLSSWPVVITIEDCYIPEWAGDILEAARTSTVEQDYGMIHALAVYAELMLKRERLN